MADSGQGGVNRRILIGAGAAAALAGTAFALRAGSSNAPQSAPADPFTLHRGNGAEPDTLDPHKASGNWENNVIGDMFMGLMTEDVGANAIPGAALRYTVSTDGLVYTFTLREHKWSDGVPVTAHDFEFSFRRILDPKTAGQYASILYPIKNAEAVNSGKLSVDRIGVHALDDRTLRMEFHFQVPYIDQLLTHYTTFAVPKHILEKYGDDWELPQNVATNGPYVLKEWIPNDHVQLVKNPHFYDRENVPIEKVYYYPTQDSAAALKRFRAGEFDLVFDSIPPQSVPWLRQHMPRELKLFPYVETSYFQFNMKRKPFDDLRLRRALSLAVDREIMTQKITRANETPAYSFVPPGIPGYPGTAHLNFKSLAMSARIAKAKWLLGEAGYGPQNPLTFDFNIMNTTETKIVGVALQAMWKEIGVEARLIPSESQIHYDVLRKHDFWVAWAGWIADYRDPKDFLFLFQTSTTDLNYGLYSNPKYDAVVEASDYERDAAKRAKMLGNAEQILLDDEAVVPVYFAVTRDLVSQQVRGWVSNNVNINRTRYLSLDRSEPV
ncbi:MAG TPA: peptide ABC transporter substrate-binding protein [Rhizomicrobium sp.]|nr:peptide ABC transporter substrate-binding protein [Rhizomicrobium sp.]